MDPPAREVLPSPKMTAAADDAPRLAELLGGLSLATDLVAGLPLETAMRTAILASRLSAELGFPVDARRAAYFASILRFIGCAAFAPEMARVAGGDDIGLLAALTPVDGGDAAGVTPPSPLPAYRHGACLELGTLGTYTTYWNVLGWPAGVVPWTTVRAGEESDRPDSKDPCHVAAREAERDSAGLPIGVQVAAAPHRDHVALAALRALERSAR